MNRFFGLLFLIGVLITPAVFSQGPGTYGDPQTHMDNIRQGLLELAYSQISHNSDGYHERTGNNALDKSRRAAAKKFKTLQAPLAADRVHYRNFLKEPNTGIFRIYPDQDLIPFTLNTFTFRDKKSPFADIRLKGQDIAARNFFAHSIMVDLGDIPVESVSLESSGVKFLEQFEPSGDIESAKEKNKELEGGITSNSFYYASMLKAKTGATYALRVIAYDNKNSIEDEEKISTFWSRGIARLKAVQREERDDLTVAFKVIRQDEEGTLTIVWKELKRKDAPTINFEDWRAAEDFEGIKLVSF
jgi:hypothetical protein